MDVDKLHSDQFDIADEEITVHYFAVDVEIVEDIGNKQEYK